MDLKVVHLGVLLDDHTFCFLILLLKRQYKNLYIFSIYPFLVVTTRDTLHW
jgi:hypothetical protein